MCLQRQLQKQFNNPQPVKQVSAKIEDNNCYFVKQDENDGETEVWYKWIVVKESNNTEIVDSDNHVLKFNSKQDAWDFIVKWHLNPCK